MPTDLQVGTPSEIIRRAFGIRGPISNAIDETIVPVALIAGLDEAPWRTNGLGCVVGAEVGALAANFSSVHFINNGTLLQQQLIVDRVYLSNPEVAVRTVAFGFRGNLLNAVRSAVTAERPSVGPSFFDNFQNIPCIASTNQLGASTITQVIGTVLVPPVTTIALELGILVPGGFTLVFEPTIVLSAINAFMVGRFFQIPA